MNANLVLLRKNGANRAFPLPGNVTVIGRRHECDLRIPLPTVSRRHCQLTLDGDTIELRDLGSTCGTFVNDERVDGEMTVRAGDCLRIGPVTFVCQIDGKPEHIEPPTKTAPKGKGKKTAAEDVARESDALVQEDDVVDLDASDSFINLDDLDADELDSDLEDLREA